MPYKNLKKRLLWEKKYKKRRAYLHKIWARKNKVRRNLYAKDYKDAHPKLRLKNKLMLRKRKNTMPWLSHYDCARTRCTNRNRNSYLRYMARGIKFLITPHEMKKLWTRDKAYTLKRPSLDRINNDGHYEYSNCRFIEMSVNSTKGNYEARWA